MGRSATKIRRRALRLDQRGGHPLYLFSLIGEELLQIADISRVSRTEAGKLIGYQRPEVRRHVQDIVEYLNTDDILFPNGNGRVNNSGKRTLDRVYEQAMASNDYDILLVGHIDTSESKPLIRLACQAQTHGAVSIVIPPWNGVFGKYLKRLEK